MSFQSAWTFSVTSNNRRAALWSQIDIRVFAAKDVDMLEAWGFPVRGEAERPPDPHPIERNDLRASAEKQFGEFHGRVALPRPAAADEAVLLGDRFPRREREIVAEFQRAHVTTLAIGFARRVAWALRSFGVYPSASHVPLATSASKADVSSTSAQHAAQWCGPSQPGARPVGLIGKP